MKRVGRGKRENERKENAIEIEIEIEIGVVFERYMVVILLTEELK